MTTKQTNNFKENNIEESPHWWSSISADELNWLPGHLLSSKGLCLGFTAGLKGSRAAGGMMEAR